MPQFVSRKPKLLSGMTNFQILILSFLMVLLCGVISSLGLLLLAPLDNNGDSKNRLPITNLLSQQEDAFIGKWEVVSGANIGALYEFFPDGTVSSGGASEYSFPDKTHVKFGWGAGNHPGTVYEYTMLSDEITLVADSSTTVLKRYAERRCVTCVWVGVDKVWEQEKLEARKILENAAESHTSGARFVGKSVMLCCYHDLAIS